MPTSPGFQRFHALLAGLCLCLQAPGLWASAAELTPPFYRHYLFLEYTGRPSPVIGRILKDEKQGRLRDSELNIKLSLARLYISLGLHFQAGKILQQLVKRDLEREMANEVWFYLARSYYHMGYLQQAEQALNRVHKGVRSPQIRAEKQHLQALILMAREDYAGAAALIQDNWWQAPDNWDLYARFNLAVALIRSDRTQQGLDLLKQTALKQPDNEEAAALIDKVNQTMGYVLLQQQQATDARPYLEAVRLHGPYSDLALLGAGWASATLQQYRQALVPWLELHGRDVRDIPVQEVMLGVPYAYEQLGAWSQAAQFYQQAIEAYQNEIDLLGQSMKALRSGAMGKLLAQTEVEPESLWLKNIRLIDRQISTRYIKQFIDDPVFFNTLNNYREARSILAQSERQTAKINRLAGRKFDQLVADKVNANAENRAQIEFMEVLATDLFKRADQLSLQARREINSHAERLQQRALLLLEKRKSLLDVYLVQARLALAQILDRQGEQ